MACLVIKFVVWWTFAFTDTFTLFFVQCEVRWTITVADTLALFVVEFEIWGTFAVTFTLTSVFIECEIRWACTVTHTFAFLGI